MSAIIEASDVACASAAFDLSCAFHKNLSPNERVALVAQLFADHRAKAVEDLRGVLLEVIESGRMKDWTKGGQEAYRNAIAKANALFQS